MASLFHYLALAPLPMLKFTDKDEAVQKTLKETFYIETTKRGVLFHPGHSWFLSMGHKAEDVDKTLEAASESMKIAKKALG